MPAKGLVRRALGSALILLCIVLATPCKASAYVDPGSGAMLWQAFAATCIGSLFYVRRVAQWVRKYLGVQSERAMGFLFATLYASVASPLVYSLFRHSQIPRFGDIYLVGIVLTAYFFTWEGAAYLLAIAMLVSAWIYAAFSRTTGLNHYALASFAVISLFLICLITRVKTRHAVPDSAIAPHRAAMGAD